MRKKVTIKDVAKAVGVTPTTVSNVLNGTNRISDETRRRVLQAVEELQYTPNMSARALVKRRTYTIGLFIPASPRVLSDSYFAEALRGMTEVALQYGYVVSIIYSDGLSDSVRQRIDGLVLTELKNKDEYVQYFKRIRMPFVALGRGGDPTLRDYVISDTNRGIREAVNHVYRLGHRHLGYLLGPLGYEYVCERYRTFRRMHAELGLSLDRRLCATGENSREGGVSAMRAILARGVRPTAIFASTDIMALGAIEYLHEHGLRVPDDMSVVGFDDADFSKYVRPSITTVHHDIYRAGREAASMLIAKLDGREYKCPVILPVRFVPRESTSVISHANQ
ncbi:LacI family transcriptional regulator [Alicyclobacillus hesperidum subsp. aegles]|uniref:LacI family DNA-binding transcriptional regulator n=1 Tax=Alicyclobacillus hesperidum TaxID=89784 RepID=UPI00222C2B75|nr:LacI family DNA-binding transcriptional regulator [Alicyclobacillus hesperidum]GLG00512.1 LacI family transcriptional regulator [Alicyclobacillus hesperidum subsp. aegles]